MHAGLCTVALVLWLSRGRASQDIDEDEWLHAELLMPPSHKVMLAFGTASPAYLLYIPNVFTSEEADKLNEASMLQGLKYDVNVHIDKLDLQLQNWLIGRLVESLVPIARTAFPWCCPGEDWRPGPGDLRVRIRTELDDPDILHLDEANTFTLNCVFVRPAMYSGGGTYFPTLYEQSKVAHANLSTSGFIIQPRKGGCLMYSPDTWHAAHRTYGGTRIYLIGFFEDYNESYFESEISQGQKQIAARLQLAHGFMTHRFPSISESDRDYSAAALLKSWGFTSSEQMELPSRHDDL